MRKTAPMTDDVNPATDALGDLGDLGDLAEDHRRDCLACQVLDRADGVMDGMIGTPRHFAIQDERRMFALLRKAEGSVADGVTSFAGSMKFVYLHGIWFGIWRPAIRRKLGIRTTLEKRGTKVKIGELSICPPE